MQQTAQTRSVQWEDVPELMLLSELVIVTRHSIKGAYGQLAAGRFPIAPLPDVRPYRFPKSNVKAWVEHGTITNKALLSASGRRRRKVA